MFPTTKLSTRLVQLLAADESSLALPASLRVGLVRSPLVLDPDIIWDNITMANFNGSSPKTPTAGAQTLITDGVTGAQGIMLKEPTGGFNWVVAAMDELPQTIYGAILYDVASDDIFAIALFPTPILLTGMGNVVSLGAIFGWLAPTPILDLPE